MSRVVSNLVNQNNLTPQMSIYKLNNYAEELDKDLKDSKAREHARNRFRNLGFSEEQVYALVPIQTSGKRVAGREPIKKTALYIMQNNLKAEEINEIAYDLAKTTTSEVAQSSRLVLLRKELRKLGADYHTLEATKIPDITYKSNKRQRELQELREDEGFDCPDFFTLEKAQERLQKCNTVSFPSMQNLTDIMIMLCMRPADVENLRINYYKRSDDEWYNSKYSWYCTGYAKNKNEKSVPRPFVSMEKNPIRARELLIWIQKSIPERFLSKGKNGNVDVNPINNFLACHGISSSHLRKIGCSHAVIVHGGKNDAQCKRLYQLAVRHKIINIASDHYSIMNSRPSVEIHNKPDTVEEIIDLYNY
ncbi:14296_t:CDS:1 [Entrophospora sp. SA101]|nr:14296_t:CDS:1 [Entrophospora sp. SA101]